MDKHKFILKAADITAMPGEKRIHFLNPNAVRINKSLGDAVGLTQLGVHIISVEPGCDTTEYHKHYYEEECIYILAGRATAIIEGERYAVGPGDFLGFARGMAAHNIINDGDEILQCLVMGQRLEQDVADYPDKDMRLYRNSSRWDLVKLADISEVQRIVLPPDKPL
ncbi:Cupin 2, conserved barrel domain protein [hydrothermal vent metagenome]|uniref:Cupin 2, conserved barrel domain protein n=1 Tax=hydrothermal vent metagenome TaxID=652676 RepID=A0A3B0ZL88_9ZZZZ